MTSSPRILVMAVFYQNHPQMNCSLDLLLFTFSLKFMDSRISNSWLMLKMLAKKIDSEQTLNQSSFFQVLFSFFSIYRHSNMVYHRFVPHQASWIQGVVINKLSKYAYFFSTLSRLYMTVRLAKIFIQYVVKLHDMPKSVVSDTGKIFISKVWQIIQIA